MALWAELTMGNRFRKVVPMQVTCQISLQYGSYKADWARETSIAGGSPLESCTNRSCKGKIVDSANIQDMKTVLETRELMGTKPVVVIVKV